MRSSDASADGANLARDLIGVWWLVSRTDAAGDGTRRIDPTLGPDPLGILTYAPGHFAAQFMKRDRSDASVTATIAAGANNTGAVGGYDAYFGTYEVDPGTGQVAHTLLGALTPGNVGMTVSRTLTADGDRLEIRLDTTTPEGEPVTRTLVWKRIG